MSDGLNRAMGVGPTITLCGQTYLVKGKILRHRAVIEAEMLKNRPDPIAMMHQLLPALRGDEVGIRALAREMTAIAKEWKSVTGDEMKSWLDTMEGFTFLMWLAIRDNDPELLTLERVGNMLWDEIQNEMMGISKESKLQQLAHAIDQASGEGPQGNSTGPQNGSATEATIPAGAV